MRIHRMIASLLLSVLLLTPLAPAFVAPLAAVAPHCVRPPLAAAPAASGMHCHEAMGHGHPMAAAESPAAPADSSREFRSNGCCTSHDCCNSTVREQWAYSVPSALLSANDRAQGKAWFFSGTASIASSPNVYNGRAPPVSLYS